MQNASATDDSIERVALEGGGLKLSRVTSNIQAKRTSKPPARIITMVWGERYLSDLLSITIPAILAPGNLPAFAEHFRCELVVVTERRFYGSLANSPVILNAMNHCDVRLLPIDDLLSPWYGITLTYALVRGFADLGATMIDTHLVFINADFILADGSYRKLAEAIRRGERLVVSPSYCMVLEDTIESLRVRYNPADCSLSIGRRDLAALIVTHRHNSVRAKTVNQRLFGIHRYDQFYWYVDEQTMVAHQMPIAVVYMRPERILTEMPTFWDYGVISEFCPTVKPCVFDDSDDFLMGELRTEGTFRELLRLGWPTVDEIAHDLSSFITHDHRVYGRYSLVVHSGDLPANIERAKAELQRFQDQIYARLTPPVSHRNHPFWAPIIPLFTEKRTEQARTMHTQPAAEMPAANQDRGRFERVAALRGQMQALELQRLTIQQDAYSDARAIEADIAHLNIEHSRTIRQMEQARVKTLATRRVELIALTQRIDELSQKVASFTVLMPHTTDRGNPKAAPIWQWLLRLPARVKSRVAFLGQAYGRIFGQLPETTINHPLNAMLQPLNDAFAANCKAQNVLVISSGGQFTGVLVRALPGRKLTITPKMAVRSLYWDVMGDSREFDLCFWDFAVEDLSDFRSIQQTLRTVMKADAKLILFHYNLVRRQLSDHTYDFARHLFSHTGNAAVRYSGSLPGALGMQLFLNVINRFDVTKVSGQMALALALATCVPFAWLASWLEKRRPPQAFRKHCTSMLIEIYPESSCPTS